MNWHHFYAAPWGTEGKHPDPTETPSDPQYPTGGSGGSSYPEIPQASGASGGQWPALPASTGAGGGSWPTLAPSQGPSGGQWDDLPASKGPEGSTLQGADRSKDHWGDFAFRIELDGSVIGGFTKVEGLTASVEKIEYQHSDDMTPRFRPGRIKYEPVRLTKGYVNSSQLFDWCDSVMKGDVARKNCSIILMADDHDTELCRYNLSEVWPMKWSGFKLDGKGQGALVEEIELCFESMERK